MAYGVTSGVVVHSPASAAASDRNADEIMHSIIAQHLLASEIGLLEATLARHSGSPSSTARILHNEVISAQSQTQADCRHLEVTLQAVRCEHTAADTALQSALLASNQLLRTAVNDLFVVQDALCQLDAAKPLPSVTPARARPSLPPPPFAADEAPPSVPLRLTASARDTGKSAPPNTPAIPPEEARARRVALPAPTPFHPCPAGVAPTPCACPSPRPARRLLRLPCSCQMVETLSGLGATDWAEALTNALQSSAACATILTDSHTARQICCVAALRVALPPSVPHHPTAKSTPRPAAPRSGAWLR